YARRSRRAHLRGDPGDEPYWLTTWRGRGSSNREFVRITGDKAIVRVQGAVELNDYNEPQPDIVLLRPKDDFYYGRQPGPGDIFLIVEIADSSLAFDRNIKAKLYAE